MRPGSDAVLQPSRMELNELSSCEVRRLNQFETADLITIGVTAEYPATPRCLFVEPA